MQRLIVIGGGAAGIFASAVCAEKTKGIQIFVLEKTRQLLAKVRISGGGRCNVTHAEYDPRKLAGNYPRGNKELLGPFHQFQPRDTIAWFHAHGVELKTEEDGRIFPTTDNSETIVKALLSAAKENGVDIRLQHSVRSVQKKEEKFIIELENREPLECEFLLLATGSTSLGYQIASSFGHTIASPVPSLFTFNVPTSPLLDLAGITVEDVELSLQGIPFKQRGPLLITHWGFSGPAALKLSAWAARDLFALNYRTELYIHFAPSYRKEEIVQLFMELKTTRPKRTLELENPLHLPMNLWKKLLSLCQIPSNEPLGRLSNKDLVILSEKLCRFPFTLEGKTTYKQEFVTCGGVCLKEVDFKTLESKRIENLFFSGEVLDIDGITGGFNFQNAWTTAYLAANAISTKSTNL